MSYRVFLVDDHGVFRSGVRAELAREDSIEVVGEAGTVGEAVAGILSTGPDVVLLDVHMPDGGGLAVLKRAPGPAMVTSQTRARLRPMFAANPTPATTSGVTVSCSPRRTPVAARTARSAGSPGMDQRR